MSLSKRIFPLISRKEPTFLSSLDKLKNGIPLDQNGEKLSKKPIRLDIAVNQLTLEMVKEKLRKEDIYSVDTGLFEYYEEDGIPKLKKAAAEFFTRYFHSAAPVCPDNLTFVTSVRGCMDVMAQCLADSGDVFIAFTPIYCKVPIDFSARSGVEIWHAPLRSEEDGKAGSFRLSVDKIEKAYESAKLANKTVKGIFLTNPGNPVGDVMSPELMMEILQFAAKNALHVIFDEIYALFVHDKNTNFRSILSVKDVPDPDRTHMIYGMSKDFGLTAWRVGIIHTWNKSLNKVLHDLASNQCIPLPIMEAATRIFSDHEWIDRLVEEIPMKASMQYRYACERLQDMGLTVRHTTASFFLWFFMGSVMKEVTFEEEEALAKELQDSVDLYIAPGKAYFCSDPGWYRAIFSVSSDEVVEGMDRLENFLKAKQKYLHNGV